jgi:O-antigen ligase
MTLDLHCAPVTAGPDVESQAPGVKRQTSNFIPELALALLLTAGAYKEWLAVLIPVPVDLTLLLSVTALAAGAARAIGNRAGHDRNPPGVSDRVTSRTLPVGLLVSLGLLALVIAVSALNTDAAYGRDKALRFLTLTMAATAAAYTILDTPARVRRFMTIIMLLGLGMALVGTATTEGMAAFNANHIATGRILGLGLIAVIYLAISSGPGLLRRLIWLVPGGVLGYGFLYAGSRGALAALIIALGFTALVALGLKRGRKWILPVAAMLAGVYIATATLVPQALDLMNDRVKQLDLSAATTGAAQSRMDFGAEAWQMFREHPFTGVGIGGYNTELGAADIERGLYPHNILLELAAEMGIAAVLLFIVLVILAFRGPMAVLRQTSNAFHSSHILLLIATTVYLLANAMFSGDINDNRMCFAALGMCFAARPFVPSAPSVPYPNDHS